MEPENGDLTPDFDFTYYEDENELDGEAAATNDSEFDEEEGEEKCRSDVDFWGEEAGCGLLQRDAQTNIQIYREEME